MKKSVVLLACIVAAMPALAASFFCRVELNGSQSVRDVADAGLTVVMERDGYCLVIASDEDLSRVRAEFRFEVLDQEPESKLYLFVTPAGGFDRSRLAEYGRVLTEDASGVVLATEEERISDLNRLPVELCRIGSEPIVLGEPAGPAPPAPLPDSLVWELVNRVNQDSVLNTIRRLQNFYTRYSTTDSCRAAVEWVRQKFIEYNCDSTALETYRSNYAPDVIGVKKGRLNPRPIYVICGHTDNTSDYEPDRCPGSDDNGSGTTAVLEACRVMADMEFDYTVYFIGFTGEEQGLYGSDSFCTRAYRRGDSIKAAMNFDMISYGRQNRDSLEIFGKTANPACAWLVDAYIANADTFSTLKTHRTMQSSPQANSDHYSFLKRGYPAFMGIERDFTPKYHTIGDTIGTLYYTNCGTNNWPMATEAIRAAVATIAKLAGAHIPTGVAEQPTRPIPARLLAVRPSLGPAPLKLTLSRASASGRIVVYDATGRLARTVAVPGSLSSAPRSISWDGRDDAGRKLSPGVYLFRLTDKGLTSTAKAVLTD